MSTIAINAFFIIDDIYDAFYCRASARARAKMTSESRSAVVVINLFRCLLKRDCFVSSHPQFFLLLKLKSI